MKALTICTLCWFVIDVTFLAGTSGLVLLRVLVPRFVTRGEAALLECCFELGEDALYSVKWYRDHEEFFRFVPKANPPATSYRLDGINVNLNLSGEQAVMLEDVSTRSAGVYRCEVSAEAPSFASVHQDARLDVVVPPTEGPRIRGDKRLYQPGDQIVLNCSAGKSHPPSTLTWYVNDQQAPESQLIRQESTHHPHGLVSTSLGLILSLEQAHFVGGTLRLRCLATLPALGDGDVAQEALFIVRTSSTKRNSCSLIFVALLPLVLTVAT